MDSNLGPLHPHQKKKEKNTLISNFFLKKNHMNLS